MAGSGRVLAIIPARAGSVGVSKKNSRILGGSPLIAYSVRAALLSESVDRVVISTDDAELILWARLNSVEALPRSPELSGGATTIAEVARSVAEALDWDGDVVVLQPTTPLRTAAHIDDAFAAFRSRELSSLITVIRQEHLHWLDDGFDLDTAEPLFESRVNRQFARHRVLEESGAIQIVSSDHLKSTGTMLSQRHGLHALDAQAGLDIDTPQDLRMAQLLLERGTVVFRLTANHTVGSGHLFHSLLLAQQLDHHRIVFILKGCAEFVEREVARAGYTFVQERNLADDLVRIVELDPRASRLLINDVLDTQLDEVLIPKSLGFSVVCIEDLGAGLRYADWVINALYGASNAASPVSSGARWAPLRGEFLHFGKRVVREEPKRILLAFGGTDPNNLGQRFSQMLSDADVGLEIQLLRGPGTPNFKLPPGVNVIEGTTSVAGALFDADLAFTSAGRTVYEAAAAGTPVIVVAQNAREATHAHLSMDNGVVFLGLAALLDDHQALAVVKRLLGDPVLRQDLANRLQNSIDGKAAQRIAHRIEGILRGLDDS